MQFCITVGPASRGPARQIEYKTASHIISRNENEYIYVYTRARHSRVLWTLRTYATLRHGRCSSNTESVSSRSFLREVLCVPNGTGTVKPKAKLEKKGNGKSNNAIPRHSRAEYRSYEADRVLYNRYHSAVSSVAFRTDIGRGKSDQFVTAATHGAATR